MKQVVSQSAVVALASEMQQVVHRSKSEHSSFSIALITTSHRSTQMTNDDAYSTSRQLTVTRVFPIVYRLELLCAVAIPDIRHAARVH